ncbi:hypothetical protein KIL84_018136 [Mauremys mutica]|uniref:Uncharacterized protein n=1 Tax=Mauremys mutica TaxID=74926 RepID=A0A9D3XT44_9SAUR|nr:hypothetical protein KIL84_018136 [Mauremys mutica]
MNLAVAARAKQLNEKLSEKSNPFARPVELIPSLYMIVLLLIYNAWKQEMSLSLHVASVTRLQYKESYTFASLPNTGEKLFLLGALQKLGSAVLELLEMDIPGPYVQKLIPMDGKLKEAGCKEESVLKITSFWDPWAL